MVICWICREGRCISLAYNGRDSFPPFLEYHSSLRNSELWEMLHWGVLRGLPKGKKATSGIWVCKQTVWWWWLFYPGLLEQSPLVPGLHFALLCGSLPLPPVFQKACRSFSLVWYCWRAIKEQVSKSTMGAFPPHPSNELSGTNSSIVRGRTLDVSSRHWRAEEWAMARAGLGVG